MSVMSEVAYDIEQLYIEGEHPTKIARTLGIPQMLWYRFKNRNNPQPNFDQE